MARKADDVVVDAPDPRERADLRGHEEAEAELIAAWRSDRLPHAWLLTGTRGIGKATLAFRFARFVLAGGGETMAMEPGHPVFRRVAAGGHSDLAVVERGEDDRGKRRAEIVIDDVRKANALAALTAGEGAWRVIVVDAADDMNRNAANALLKLLEEPPARALLLLVSHAPSRLLPTIRSRCRTLAMRPLDDAALGTLLRAALPETDDADLAALARISEGSPGRGIALARQGGLDLYRRFIALVTTLPEPDTRALHQLADGLAGRDGVDRFRALAELIQWWLARAIGAAARGDAGQISEVVPGEATACARLLGTGDRLDQWVGVWENLSRAFAQAEGLNLEPRQVLLSAFATLQQEARA